MKLEIAQSQWAKLEQLLPKVTEEPLAETGHHFTDGMYCDLTQCSHGDTGYYRNKEDGQAVAILWNLWKSGRLQLVAPPSDAPADPTLAMIQAGCRALNERDKGNCISVPDVKAIIAAAIGAVLSPVERWAMVFDGEEGWGMEPASDGEYVKFVDHAAAVAMPKLFGPYGHLNGHRALNEESWAVEDDPMENDEEYFSIPLYALVEPVFPVMHGFPPDAQPFDGSKYGIEDGEAAKEETIKIDGRSYRKFIRHPEEITDGTLRCISCGQIDEDEYHDDDLCPGINPEPSK